MKHPDCRQFCQLLMGLAELYRVPLSEALTDIYWHALKRFELAEIARALNVHVCCPDVGQYFPKPADIVRRIEGSSQAQAQQAWASVTKAMRQQGAYASVAFDDCLIHAVVRNMGGWIHLCQTPERALPFRAQEFQSAYQALLQRPPKACPNYLPGSTERARRAQGQTVAPPCRIKSGVLPNKKSQTGLLKNNPIKNPPKE